jgi:16S rRNA (cytidine1402-2'-O)-methyltransferase
MNAGDEDAAADRGGRPGILYVVATPIGNLEDLSPRARDVLARAHRVAAEDTRHTGQLLTRLGLRVPLVSLHEHNESGRVPGLIAELAAGHDLALVTDAGTPLISDPGFRLVAAAREAGLPVSPVPGPCAAVAALSVAGLPTDRFHFEGFLPSRGEPRRTRLGQLAGRPETLVFYESVHRVLDTLADLARVLGPHRPAAVARELTKVHETLYRGTLAELATTVGADPSQLRGEYVLVVGGAPESGPDAAELVRVVGILAEALPPAQAAALAARITGASRKEAYRLAVGAGPEPVAPPDPDPGPG